jgi:TatD DNase family protein
MLIDFHTHQNTSEPNIKKLFNLDINEEVLELDFESFFGSNPSVSVGIHPWSVSVEKYDLQLEFLEKICGDNRVKAIGEIGLDKVKGSEFRFQEEVFLKQIRVAERVRKPIIIHCVRSFNELIGIKKIIKPKVPLVIHGFNKKPEMAIELTKKGFNLSFGQAVLDSEIVQESLKNTPIDQMFFETDDCNGLNISEIYKKASEMLNLEISVLEERIYQNYLELFI